MHYIGAAYCYRYRIKRGLRVCRSVCWALTRVNLLVELRKNQWRTTPRRRKRRDFDAVYYMEVNNRSGGNPPSSPVIRALDG